MPQRKYDIGDRVLVTNKERWCVGCTGIVKGAWGLPKHAPYYLIHLEDSPSPYIKDTYVYEEDIETA